MEDIKQTNLPEDVQFTPQLEELLKQFVAKHGAGTSIEGRASVPTTTSIGANLADVPQLLDFSVKDFAVGITWTAVGSKFTIVTAGKYLVGGQADISIGSAASVEPGYFLIYKGGAEVNRFVAISGTTANQRSVACGSDILDLAVGDEITFYCMTGGNDAKNLDVTSGRTFGFICKV